MTYTLHGDLAGMNNARLHAVCRELGVARHSRMNRKQMQQAILEAQAEPEAEAPR